MTAPVVISRQDHALAMAGVRVPESVRRLLDVIRERVDWITGICTWGIAGRRLGQLTRMLDRTVQRALAWALRRGWLRVVRRDDRGRNVFALDAPWLRAERAAADAAHESDVVDAPALPEDASTPFDDVVDVELEAPPVAGDVAPEAMPVDPEAEPVDEHPHTWLEDDLDEGEPVEVSVEPVAGLPRGDAGVMAVDAPQGAEEAGCRSSPSTGSGATTAAPRGPTQTASTRSRPPQSHRDTWGMSDEESASIAAPPAR